MHLCLNMKDIAISMPIEEGEQVFLLCGEELCGMRVRTGVLSSGSYYYLFEYSWEVLFNVPNPQFSNL